VFFFFFLQAMPNIYTPFLLYNINNE